jgi:hypothetical protein
VDSASADGNHDTGGSMTGQFVMDKEAIKIAAENFMQALFNWKNPKNILAIFQKTRLTWTEEQLRKSEIYTESIIDPIILAYQPIYDLAMRQDIDEPFDFIGYIMSRVGRVLSDELSYPEITNSYNKLYTILRGGLTHEEFWETDYYKKHLLPKKFPEVLS